MDVLMLSTAIAALAVAVLVLACSIAVCTIVLRKPEPGSDVSPDDCVVAMGPEASVDSVNNAGSFTLPLPPGFGMSPTRLS